MAIFLLNLCELHIKTGKMLDKLISLKPILVFFIKFIFIVKEVSQVERIRILHVELQSGL